MKTSAVESEKPVTTGVIAWLAASTLSSFAEPCVNGGPAYSPGAKIAEREGVQLPARSGLDVDHRAVTPGDFSDGAGGDADLVHTAVRWRPGGGAEDRDIERATGAAGDAGRHDVVEGRDDADLAVRRDVQHAVEVAVGDVEVAVERGHPERVAARHAGA